VELRPATAGDFEAMHAALVAAEGALRERHAFPWTPPPLDTFARVHAHLLRWDPDRQHVAEADGRVAGFAAAFVRDDTWFLSDLFVEPELQGRGIGSRLLDLAWGEGPERRMTLADAIQPVSNAMYARRGLVPTTPVVELGGRPSTVEPPGSRRSIPRRGS
jgi:GNAT superfamily N-acetyltransferase